MLQNIQQLDYFQFRTQFILQFINAKIALFFFSIAPALNQWLPACFPDN